MMSGIEIEKLKINENKSKTNGEKPGALDPIKVSTSCKHTVCEGISVKNTKREGQEVCSMKVGVIVGTVSDAPPLGGFRNKQLTIPGAFPNPEKGDHSVEHTESIVALIAREGNKRKKVIDLQMAERRSDLWCAAEFMCGVATLSSAFADRGVMIKGLCEKQEDLLGVIARRFPGVQLACDISQRDWRAWNRNIDLEVVMGGPMCNPFSTAGKQLGGEHEQSDQIFLMEEAASALSARWLLIENVPNLLEKFESFFKGFTLYCEKRDWVLLGSECLNQAELGGSTRRKRIWPLFEKREVASRLPPWENWSGTLKPSPIRLVLEGIDSVNLSNGLVGHFDKFTDPVVGNSGVMRAGTFWMGDSEAAELTRGNVVRLKPDYGENVIATHKGKQISLCAQTERFVVLEIRQGRVKLLHDNRSGPLWLWRSETRIQELCRSSTPVFSVDGPGPTVRSMRVPPGENGFLIFDDRRSPGVVRPLTGLEIWRLQGLPDLLAAELRAADFTMDKIGELAGSSIPAEMCSLQADRLCSRVKFARELEFLEQTSGVPWLHVRAPSVCGIWTVKTILCVVQLAGECKLLAHISKDAVPGICVDQKSSSESCVQMAQRWASALLESEHLGFLGAEKSEAGRTVRMVVVPTRDAQSHKLPGVLWASISDLREAKSGLAELLLLASARIASFQLNRHELGPLTVRGRDVSQKRFRWRASEKGGWSEGRTPVMLVEPETFGKSEQICLQQWEEAIEKLREDQEALRDVIRKADVDHPAYAWLQETADVMKPLDVTDFPMELLQCSLGDVTKDMAIEMPMPDEFKPPETEWLHRREQQLRPPLDFRPNCLADLVGAEGMLKLKDWTQKAVADLIRMRDLGAAAGRKHREVLVLSQEDLVPQARGIYWDLRGAREGRVVPLDFSVPVETHLDLAYLKALCDGGALSGYPDQQLISQLLLGVRYRDTLDMQIVLLPHLISFGGGCVEIQQEMLDLEEKGWYSFHDELPFVPFRNIPRGSTLKTDGTHRPTSELGAPRHAVYDRSGKEVVPQNVAIGQNHWEKEVKPTMGQFMQALAVLLTVAKLSGEPVFFFSDDMQKMFNQLRLAPEQLWTSNSLLLGKNDEPMWAAEEVMPFGVKCGSYIAQGWAHLLLFLVRETMDRMEAANEEPNRVLEGLLRDRKKKWSKQSQTGSYYTVMFTDDSATAVIGLQRTVRYLCAWHEVTTRFNIMMAPPRKRQLGCRMQWVGGIVLATGAVTVALQKRVRAVQELKRLLAGRMTVSSLRKLMGLLEHFIYILALKRNLVAALYEPLKGETSFENPDRKVTPSKSMCSTTGRLIKVVAHKAGNFVTSFTSERMPLCAASRVISWHSDAAKERDFEGHLKAQFVLEGDTLGIGLGGYAAGYWWNWPLTEDAHELHISSLEALAFALNFFMFGALFEEMIGPETALLTHCDALASVFGVAFGRSKAPLLIYVFDHLEKIPVFKKLKKFTATTHVAGPGNLLADAASRGLVQVIKDFTAQIGVTAVRKRLPRSALEFVNKTVAYARSLTLVEQNLALEQPSTPDSASFQAWKIPRMVSDDGRMLGNSETSGRVPVAGEMKGLSPRHCRGIPRMVSDFGEVLDDTSGNKDTIDSQEAEVTVPPQTCKTVRVSENASVPAASLGGKRLSALQQGRRDALQGLSLAVAAGVADTLASETCLQLQGKGLHDMLEGMFGSVLESVPEGTKTIDARDWELWCSVMGELGVAPWRGDIAAHRGLDSGGYWREVILQAIAFYRCLKDIKPRKRRLNADGRAIPGKPESVSVIKSVRRIHGYFGVQMPESRIYSKVLKAANAKFIEENGLAALMPHRKEPFTNPEIQRMLAIPQGTKLNGRLVDNGSRFWRSVELLIKVQAQTGFRLGDALKMNRDALMFDFKEKVLPMAEERMRLLLGPRDFAIITPQRTKSDPLGTHWSPFPVYLEAGDEDTIGAGRALYYYDMDFYVPLISRHKEPLFTDDQGSRLTRPVLERVLHDLLVKVHVDPESHSWHSFRIYLAVALKQAGADDSRIKAMVRWVSDKSLRIYARDSKSEYTGWLRKAAVAEVDTVYVQSLPEIDEDRVMAALNDLLRGDIEA